MFGDELSFQECCTLVKSLAECDFPFQCAHGRPSIVPLLQVSLTEV
jgi:DNA mismatch repair protein MLH3